MVNSNEFCFLCVDFQADLVCLGPNCCHTCFGLLQGMTGGHHHLHNQGQSVRDSVQSVLLDKMIEHFQAPNQYNN